jgi:hypothetical protein
MNAPYYPPDTVDWEDGLNPLAIPSYREQRNPAVYARLQQPTMVELRNTPGLELSMYAAPDAATQVPPGATYDSIIQIPAGAWIIGVSASSAQPEGFLAQLTTPTGATLFNQPTHSKNLQARPHFLARPQGIPATGPLTLRLINLSALANSCQLAAWVIQPQ